MTTLTIRNVDAALKQRLRVRAAHNGRSMEAELRQILCEALGGAREDREPNLVEAIRRRFLPLGGRGRTRAASVGTGRRSPRSRPMIALDTTSYRS